MWREAVHGSVERLSEEPKNAEVATQLSAGSFSPANAKLHVSGANTQSTRCQSLIKCLSFTFT